jgi:hypothetical protein
MSNRRKIKPAQEKPPAGPVLLSSGKYALYESPGGGAVLSWRPDGAGEDAHQQIPPALWALMGQAMRGEKISPQKVISTVMGMR